MEEIELVELLEQLEEMLPELGLAAVVAQERAAAAEGRVQAARDDSARGGRGRVPRPERGDVRVSAMTTAERLSMLLDLIEVAVGGTYAMTDQVRSFVDSEVAGERLAEPDVLFSPDRAEGFVPPDDLAWVLPTRGSVNAQRRAVQQVLLDLSDLRAAIGIERAVELEPRADLQAAGFDRTLGWA